MRIAVTRLREKAGKDAETCKRYGHECYIVSPLNARVYEKAVMEFVSAANRDEFDCIFFTSALPAQVIGPLLQVRPRMVAIGPQTAKTLTEMGFDCETLPDFYSRDFAPYLGDWIRGKKIGIPRADVPNPQLIDSIEDKGGIAAETRIYGLEPTGEKLDLDGADAVLFTSAGSFRNAVWDKDQKILRIAIGDVTGKAMDLSGCPPDVTGDGSLAGTLEALNKYLESGDMQSD
ncbi:uroporphyrinogen-III synthase [Methanolacinia paynteri]|uniref:uroporphyrinogen-III synthase n=1 Tax=Methanolacinia paynteri TaxID=230356 RepID=UPI00064F070B|nr:uroporphyrinogen-III synthase [Methanolacinia paynteri]